MAHVDPKLWLVIFLVAFLAINAVLLRISCRVTNYATHWSSRWLPLEVPRYRSCIWMVFGVLIILSLLTACGELLIASWAAHLVPVRVWNAMVFVVELVLVVKLISWSLSDAQPVPTRLTTVAAVVHVFLVLGLGLVAGEVFASLNS